MAISRERRVEFVPQLSIARQRAVACSRAAETDHTAYATTPARLANSTGLVGPLKDDSGDQIVSWVDGQIVTDWPRGSREARSRHRWLPGRLRSGPRRELRFPQRAESAAGLELVPQQPGRVQRRAVRPASRRFSISIRITRIRRCAPSRASGNARRPSPGRLGTSTAWTLDHIGVGPDPSDYVDGVARPVGQRQTPLPFGFAFENARDVRAADRRRENAPPTRGCWRARVHRTRRLLIAKLQTADKEENWEHDRPGFGSPGTMDRVFFSCAACHVGRVVVVGQDEVPARHAQHRDRSAVLLEAPDADRGRARRVGFRSGVDRARESRRHQAQYERHPRAVHRDAGQGAPAAGNAVRLVAGADRPRQAAGAGRGRRVSQRDAGSHRRRRQDALHLPRRREEQRLQAAAAGHLRGPSRPDGRLRHRLGPGRHPHAPQGQQLSGIRPARQPGEPVLLGILEGERPARRHAGHDRARDGPRRPPAIGSSRTFPRGRRRFPRRSTSRASTGRPSATTPTGTAIRAPRRGRWPRARRRPATRAWSTCASTNR